MIIIRGLHGKCLPTQPAWTPPKRQTPSRPARAHRQARCRPQESQRTIVGSEAPPCLTRTLLDQNCFGHPTTKVYTGSHTFALAVSIADLRRNRISARPIVLSHDLAACSAAEPCVTGALKLTKTVVRKFTPIGCVFTPIDRAKSPSEILRFWGFCHRHAINLTWAASHRGRQERSPKVWDLEFTRASNIHDWACKVSLTPSLVRQLAEELRQWR